MSTQAAPDFTYRWDKCHTCDEARANVELGHLAACSEVVEDGARLGGLFKVYVVVFDAV